MNTRLRPVLIAGAVLLCALGLTTACSGGKKKDAQAIAPAPASTTVTTTATPKPTPTVKPKPKPAPINPLTGGKPAKGPVIAVKIDDTPPGRPQYNIDKADIVYIEEAEGGLSRLLAVFDSKKPTVGYVRSVRASDPELLLQYGKITLAESGGAHNPLSVLDRSGIKAWSNDRGAAYYHRVSRSESSYINLVLNLAQVSKKAKTPAARSIGLTWSARAPGISKTPKAHTIKTHVGTQLVEFVWDAKIHRYIRVINGVRQKAADGSWVSTPNVIVQTCKVTVYRKDTDVNHNPSQYTHTVGTGKVVVFRNDHEIVGTWHRRSTGSGTVLLDAKGHRINLEVGGAWFALVRSSAKLSVS